MAQVINIGIPHVAKKIFEHVDISGLIQCLYVSKTWRQLAQETFENRLNDTDDFGRTPFALACINGYTFVVRIILDCPESKRNRPYLNKRSKSFYYNGSSRWQNPFMDACENGHEDIVKLLLDYSGSEEIDFNMETHFRKITAFVLACEKGQLKVIKLLLDYSARKSINLKTRDIHGLTPLEIAITNGNNEVFKLLLDYSEREDVDIDIIDVKENGSTTFKLACKLGQTEMVRAILDHSQSIKMQINEIGYGTTGFMDGFLEATRYSQVDVANVLLYHPKTQNINWNAWDGKTGTGPLFLRVCEIHQSREIVRLILDHSFFDLNVRGEFGRTGFMIACSEHCLVLNPSREVIELLMQNSVRCNIDLNAKDDNGQTTFMIACAKGRKGLVKRLLENSQNTHLDFNAIDNKGRTGLMLACSHMNSGVAILLIEYIKRRYNIQLNIKDCFGNTALKIACQYGKVQIVKKLSNVLMPDEIKELLEENWAKHLVTQGNYEADTIEQLEIWKALEEAQMEEDDGVVEANEDVLLDTQNNKGEDDIEGTGGAETYEELLEDMDYMEASDETDDNELSYESDNDVV